MRKDAQGRYTIDNRGSYITQGWLRYFGSEKVPGMHENGWHNDTSYAFLEAYELQGGASTLGSPDTRPNETPYVHDWCVQTACITLQDFWGGTYGDATLILNTWMSKAFIIRTAFWEYYRTNNGPIELGAPIENEHTPIQNQTHFHPCPQTMLACQGFQKGTLMWDGTTVSGMSHLPPLPPVNLQVR